VSPVQTRPPWDQVGVSHFHSSTISGSAACTILRTFASVFPRQSPSSLIFSSIRAEADSAGMALFMYSSCSRAWLYSTSRPASPATPDAERRARPIGDERGPPRGSARRALVRRRGGHEDQRAQQAGEQRASEDAEPEGRRVLGGHVLEGESADEQAHGESDAAQHADAQELPPARAGRQVRDAAAEEEPA